MRPLAERSAKRLLFLLLALLASLAPAQAGVEGRWEGSIGPGTLDLGVVVVLEPSVVGWTGTIDIPAQGAAGLPLDGVAVEDGTVRFTIAGVPGNPTFAGRLDGDRLEGEFRQSGQTFPFALKRLAEDEAPRGLVRPQEPEPPFPYGVEEVAYANGEVRIAATLTLPATPGPHPAVMMVTGSGPQDRDEALLGHRPFLVIADALTRAGFAVLRGDDRGVGGSGGRLSQATYDDLVGDVLAGVAFLQGRDDIDPARIGLFGHSEGGLLAPLAAVRSSAVAFTVLMAAPAVTSEEILILQNRLIYERAGAEEVAIADQIAYLEALADALEQGDEALARRLVRDQVEEQLGALPEGQRPAPENREALIEAQVADAVSPYFRSFLLYDPQPALRRLTVPVLAFYGTLDLQVPAVQNAGPMEEVLRAAGNPDVTVEVFEGLNHLMQPAATGAIEEYARIETTIAPAVLELVTSWLRERFLEEGRR